MFPSPIEGARHPSFVNPFFKTDFIYLFLENGEGKENERERNIYVPEKHQSVVSRTSGQGTWPTTQTCAPTRNQVMGPFSLWDNAQPTEPYQSGLIKSILSDTYFYACWDINKIPHLQNERILQALIALQSCGGAWRDVGHLKSYSGAGGGACDQGPANQSIVSPLVTVIGSGVIQSKPMGLFSWNICRTGTLFSTKFQPGRS